MNGKGQSLKASLIESCCDTGLGCLIADSINGLFFRNCVNWGFLALECPGISSAFDEGDLAEVSFGDFTVTNRRTGEALQAGAIPDELLNTMKAGGVFPVLEAEGLVAPAAPTG